jgi:hypothetical protein
MAGKPLTKEEKAQANEDRKKIAELDDQRQRQLNRAAALAGIEAGAKERDAEKKAVKDLEDYRKEQEQKRIQEARRNFEEEMRQYGERTNAIKRMEEQTRTPQERAQAEIERIQGMLRAGDIPPELAMRGMSKAIESLPQQKNTQEALLSGSSGAMSAIIKAQAGLDNKTMEKDIGKLVQEAMETNRILQDVKRNTQEAQVIEFN